MIISVFIFILQTVLQFAGQLLKVLLLLSPMISLLMYAGIQHAASVQEYDEEPPAIRHLCVPLEGKVFEFVLLFGLLIGVSVGSWLLFQGLANQLGLIAPNLALLSRADKVLLGLLAVFCLSLIGFVFWFAPALVFLRDENPFAAIVMSLKAGFKNIVPFFVFFIIQWLLAAAVIFVMTLGNAPILMLLSIPFFLFYQVFMGFCCYASYRDIWFEEVA